MRDISEVSEVGVTTIQQFRHLGPFTHPLSSSPSADHARACLFDRSPVPAISYGSEKQ